MANDRILFIYTSAGMLLDGQTETGWFLPEAAWPYYLLEPHFQIHFASPKGPNPPRDPWGDSTFATDPGCIKFLADPKVTQMLANCKKLADIKSKDYDAFFYVGGHGPVIDVASDPINIRLASEMYVQNKVLAAVCHGPAALANVTYPTKSGPVSIFKGRRFTGFSNKEEDFTGTKEINGIPFRLEDKIAELGGQYERADVMWDEHVVVDGKIITGQNPVSTMLTACELGNMLNPALKLNAKPISDVPALEDASAKVTLDAVTTVSVDDSPFDPEEPPPPRIIIIAKRIRNLTKKLKAIDLLKAKQKRGDSLELNQVTKIASEARIRKELEFVHAL